MSVRKLKTVFAGLITEGHNKMKRANKAKVRARNQSANKFMENVPITIYPSKKIEKPVSEVKKGVLSDEEYVAGFAENKKRVTRTPPETLKKWYEI